MLASRPGMPGEKSRAEGRSEEMMAAALDLFARHDVSSVTIKDIAKQTAIGLTPHDIDRADRAGRLSNLIT